MAESASCSSNGQSRPLSTFCGKEAEDGGASARGSLEERRRVGGKPIAETGSTGDSGAVGEISAGDVSEAAAEAARDKLASRYACGCSGAGSAAGRQVDTGAGLLTAGTSADPVLLLAEGCRASGGGGGCSSSARA